MKFNFWGYDTKVMLDLGLDFNDLAFIQWFRDFRDSGKMETITIDNNLAYYISYSKVAQDIPQIFLNPTGTESIAELKKMNDANRKRVLRMLTGSLSKLFTRHEKKEAGKTKIYVTCNADVLTALINNGRGFDNKIISTRTKVVKLNKIRKKDNKKAPTTVPPVVDADTKTDQDNQSSNFNIEDSLPQNNTPVNTNLSYEIDEDGVVIEKDEAANSSEPVETENEAAATEPTNTEAVITGPVIPPHMVQLIAEDKLDDVNPDELNLNATLIWEYGIKSKNWKKLNETVANWSRPTLGKALDITLQYADKPNFNYIQKTYESLIANGVEEMVQ